MAGSDAVGSRATLRMAGPSVPRSRQIPPVAALPSPVPERVGSDYRGTEGAGQPDDGRGRWRTGRRLGALGNRTTTGGSSVGTRPPLRTSAP